jgi:hypothetical protein
MRLTWTLLASAPTLNDITASVARFYCGEQKELRPDGREWHLYGPRRVGTALTFGKIPAMRVVCKRGRYRFEMGREI